MTTPSITTRSKGENCGLWMKSCNGFIWVNNDKEQHGYGGFKKDYIGDEIKITMKPKKQKLKFSNLTQKGIATYIRNINLNCLLILLLLI